MSGRLRGGHEAWVEDNETVFAAWDHEPMSPEQVGSQKPVMSFDESVAITLIEDAEIIEMLGHFDEGRYHLLPEHLRPVDLPPGDLLLSKPSAVDDED